MYPWPEEESINDFKWDSLPVTYSASYCNERQVWNIQKAEKIIEDYTGYNLYEFKDMEKGQINFNCHDSFYDVLLNYETDFWDTTIYFPASQPYFYFNDNQDIKEVEIILFAQNRTCGGIETHELLHGIGLRNHYGPWMKFETELCDLDTLVLSNESKEKIKEIYSLK
jgi:hypothetical protein